VASYAPGGGAAVVELVANHWRWCGLDVVIAGVARVEGASNGARKD
jgi:hypothetical protein